MKRRILRTKSATPPRVRIGLHGPQDIGRVKRGKFTDLENAHPRSCRVDADVSSMHIRGTQATRSDDPKTSEYAYFKKLKQDASQSFDLLHKEDNQSKKFKSSDCTREIMNMVQDDYKDLKSSVLIEEVKPINFNSFVSPYGNASKNKGTQCMDEETFCRKRQKLRQWVEASFPEIDELCLKGYDFISLLLSRLFPKTSENKISEHQKLQQAETDMKSNPLAFSQSYIHSNKIQYSPRQNFMELENGAFLDNGSSCYQIDKSRERILWNWDLDSESPTCPPSKSSLLYQKEKLDCGLDGKTSACLCTENDSTFGFSFEKYGLRRSIHIKELDEFQDQEEFVLARKSDTFLLDWDLDNMKGDQNLCIAYPINMYPTLPISLADDYLQTLDDKFDASGLFSSSFRSYTSLSPSYSESYPIYDFGQHKHEERKCLVTEPSDFPLTLSNYPNLTEDCTHSSTRKDTSILQSSQNNHLPMSTFFNKKQHPDLEALLLSSGLDFDLRQKPLLLTDYPGEHPPSTCHTHQFPQKEGLCFRIVEDKFQTWLEDSSHKETLGHFFGDVLNIHEWSSVSFKIPLNKDMPCPLLLNSPCWVTSESEMDYDDW